jgi:hypothetical protein
MIDENTFSAKKNCWVHEPPASVALLLGPKNYDEFFFGPLKRFKNHKNIDVERFL